MDVPYCKVCGTHHFEYAPHDATSITYQLNFRARNGRNPTWMDAMAHCPPDTRDVTLKVLEAYNIDPSAEADIIVTGGI